MHLGIAAVGQGAERRSRALRSENLSHDSTQPLKVVALMMWRLFFLLVV